MPQTSFAFFTVAEGADLEHLPALVVETYTIITWKDAHPAVETTEPVQKTNDDALTLIEASFLRAGGVPRLGVTPAQRLGLAPTPFRDAAWAAMHKEAQIAARRIALSEGDVRDTKRVRLSDFNRGAGIVVHNLGGSANFGVHTVA